MFAKKSHFFFLYKYLAVKKDRFSPKKEEKEE